MEQEANSTSNITHQYSNTQKSQEDRLTSTKAGKIKEGMTNMTFTQQETYKIISNYISFNDNTIKNFKEVLIKNY